MAVSDVQGTSLDLQDVSVWRESGGKRTAVTRHVTISVKPGERVFLLGPNGAGKTSLLLAIVGAVPFEGRISVGSTVVEQHVIDTVRSRVAFVFADPSDQLFTDEVREEVRFGPRTQKLPDVEGRVTRALRAVDLEAYAGRAPSHLSLGEQRRLAIATALAVDPELLLLDEPTAALDPRARRRVLDGIGGLAATVVLATHDLDAARQLGGRVVLLNGGHAIADGPCEGILSDERLLDEAGLSDRAPG